MSEVCVGKEWPECDARTGRLLQEAGFRSPAEANCASDTRLLSIFGFGTTRLRALREFFEEERRAINRGPKIRIARKEHLCTRDPEHVICVGQAYQQVAIAATDLEYGRSVYRTARFCLPCADLREREWKASFADTSES